MSICHMESSSKAEQGAGAPESSSQHKAAWGWLGTQAGLGTSTGPRAGCSRQPVLGCPGSAEGTANHKG